MSIRDDPIYPPSRPIGRVTIAPPRPARERSAHRRRARPRATAAEPASPTTSIWKVLATLLTSFILALVFGVRGLVHAGEGMPDGVMRAATLAAGHAILPVAEDAHLTWPWDQVEAALGRQQQPNVPPLLAGPPTPPPLPVVVPVRPVGPPYPAPKPHQKKTASPQPRPAGPPVPSVALRRITLAHPLRLLVTGDSLSGFLGPELINEATARWPVLGFTDTHNGTGLTRPDFVDWSIVAQQQVNADRPDAVVVFIGGNDFQNMTLPNGKFFQAGTPSWTREYQRRAEICMRIWAGGGVHRVYWLSMPPARDRSWAYDDAHINIALSSAASDVQGAEYLDILGPVTDHGRYTDYINQHGQPVLIREQDGVHLNEAGSQIVADEIMPILRRDWHLR